MVLIYVNDDTVYGINTVLTDAEMDAECAKNSSAHKVESAPDFEQGKELHWSEEKGFWYVDVEEEINETEEYQAQVLLNQMEILNNQSDMDAVIAEILLNQE